MWLTRALPHGVGAPRGAARCPGVLGEARCPPRAAPIRCPATSTAQLQPEGSPAPATPVSSCLARLVPPAPPALQVTTGTLGDRGGDGWLVPCCGQGAGNWVVPAGAEAARQRKPPARRCHAQPGARVAVWQVVFSHQCFWFFFFKSLQAKQLK